jgi:uncharacterized membrane protein YhhN
MGLLKNKIVAFFFLVLIIHCLFIYLDISLFRGITKAILIPVLFVYLRSGAGKKAPWLVYAGLFFAFCGDVLLLGGGDLFFLAGMLAFVASHICNSLYFLRITDHNHGRLREAFGAAVILMILSVTVFIILNEHMGSFRIPVLVYMLVISIMTILAAHTAGNPALRKAAWNCFIPGAGFFVISDMNLALNKFLFGEPLSDIATMVFYALAEFFLVRGFIAVSSISVSSKQA